MKKYDEVNKYFKMKRKLIILVLCIVSNNYLTLSAQSLHNEFKIAYGVASGTEIGVALGSAIGASLGASIGIGIGDVVSIIVSGVPTNVTVVEVKTEQTPYFGTALLGYQRYLSKRVSVGTQFNYNPIRQVTKVTYSNGVTSENIYQYHYISLYARLDFNYVVQPKFQLYSAIMAGGMVELSESEWYFAPHLTVLGFRFGRDNALSAELGIGLGPLIALGYSRKF